MNVVSLEEYRKKKALEEFFKILTEFPTEADLYLIYWNIKQEDFVTFLEGVNE